MPVKLEHATRQSGVMHSNTEPLRSQSAASDKLVVKIGLNFFFACGDFCHLLITFANSLDPNQDWQKVGPDLDQNR